MTIPDEERTLNLTAFELGAMIGMLDCFRRLCILNADQLTTIEVIEQKLWESANEEQLMKGR